MDQDKHHKESQHQECKHHHHSETPTPNTNADPDAIYTCPMHPEVRQIGPGSCPKCGMALEPLIASDEENEELIDMTRRFILASVFTVPLFVVSMGDLLPGQPISKPVSYTHLTLPTSPHV